MNTVDAMYRQLAGELITMVNRGAQRGDIAKWLRSRIVYLAAIEEAERMYATGEAQNYAKMEKQP